MVVAEQDQNAIAAVLGGGPEGEQGAGREGAARLLDAAMQRGHEHATCMTHDAASA